MSDKSAGHGKNSEDAKLVELGYQPRFRRVFGLFADFSLGYSYMGPYLGVVGLFAWALTTAGPGFFWTMLVILAGQLLVCLTFAEAASAFPIAGGVYQWARKLGGNNWGFLTAWIYVLGLIGSTAGCASAGGPFVSALLGLPASAAMNTAVGLCVAALAAVLNMSGPRVLAKVTEVGVWAGLFGLALCGTYMLIFARQQDFSVLFQTFGKSTEGFAGPALAASLIGVWIFYGFEACGDLAEEVKDASSTVPKAMLMTIVGGGISALLITLGILLAVPDMNAAVTGAVADPVSDAVINSVGPLGNKIALFAIALMTLSGTASMLASTSRLLFSLGRDRAIAGGAALSRMTRNDQPMIAIITVSIIVLALISIGFLSKDAITNIISFATTGIYTSFQMVVLAAIVAVLRGWRPSGSFRLGRFGMPVRVGALVFGVAAITNLMWPRNPEADWMTNHLILVSMAVIVATGLLQLSVGAFRKKATLA
ncbi:amino acid permease [Rhizobium leguminosarum]|uniref:amino acid permease n=1 Tax=Rhizobium leguminosarum TaxID=384 RepID=UPI003F9D7344